MAAKARSGGLARATRMAGTGSLAVLHLVLLPLQGEWVLSNTHQAILHPLPVAAPSSDAVNAGIGLSVRQQKAIVCDSTKLHPLVGAGFGALGAQVCPPPQGGGTCAQHEG